MKETLTEIQTLQDLLAREIFKAMGWRPDRWSSRLLRPLFARATRRFSEIGIGLDRLVADRGFAETARWTLPKFIQDFVAYGTEHIPAEGPLLIASNHPGVADSLLITACLARRDIKIVAGAIPFFQHLPNVSRHLIYAPANVLHARVNVIRTAIRHLLEGGALLIFARGQVGPDPATMPDGGAEFGRDHPGALQTITESAGRLLAFHLALQGDRMS